MFRSLKYKIIIGFLLFASFGLILFVYMDVHLSHKKINESTIDTRQQEGVKNIVNDFDNDLYSKSKERVKKDSLFSALIDNGIAKATGQDYKGAIAQFNNAIELCGEYQEAYYFKALTELIINENEGAISDFKKIYKFEDKNPFPGYVQRYRYSIKDFDKVININPNNAVAFKFRGDYKVKSNDYQGAVDDYNMAINLNPNYADIYLSRGKVKNKLNDYKGAEEEYTKAIKLKPDNGEAYCERGQVRILLKDTLGAIADWKKAKNTKTIYGIVASTLLKTYEEIARDKKESEELSKKIIELQEK